MQYRIMKRYFWNEADLEQAHYFQVQYLDSYFSFRSFSRKTVWKPYIHKYSIDYGYKATVESNFNTELEANYFLKKISAPRTPLPPDQVVHNPEPTSNYTDEFNK